MILAGIENIQECADLAYPRVIEVLNEFLNANKEEKIIIVEEGKGIFIGSTFMLGNQKISTDVLWYVKPEFRKDGIGTQLLDAFEFWSQKVGVNLITMTSLNPSIGKEYFEKKGYTLQGLAWHKEINKD